MKQTKNTLLEVLDSLRQLKSEVAGLRIAKNNISESKIAETPVCPVGVDPDAYLDFMQAMGRYFKAKPTEGLNKERAEEGGKMTALKEGSLYKRADGIWMGKYYDNGIRKSVYASNRLAIVKKMNEAVAERDRRDSESIATKKTTLNAWMKDWIEIYKKPKLKPASLKLISHVLKPVSRSSLGGKKVSAITPIDIEKFLNGIKAPSMQSRTYIVLNEMMTDLLKNKVIHDNPCFSVRKPGMKPTAEKKNLTEDEFREFFDRLKERSPKYYLFASFLVNTGLRKGEALALTWEDVDFENRTIHVCKSFDLAAKKVSTPKTAKSNRYVPLFDGAIEALRSLKTKGEVFDVGKQAASKWFREMCADIGFPGMNLHTLRHLFASRCMQAGIDGKVVQKWLGHAKYDMTINTYTHVSTDFEQSQVEKVNETWRKNDENH